jgi:alpha-glucosidase
VYDSPSQMVSDSPAQYRDAAGKLTQGADFISAVPASWDETHGLQGQIGEFAVVARRAGPIWYVGAMTNEIARTVRIPLRFLGPGRYRATLWQDGAGPARIVRQVRTGVAASSTLALRLAATGGGVIRIERE